MLSSSLWTVGTLLVSDIISVARNSNLDHSFGSEIAFHREHEENLGDLGQATRKPKRKISEAIKNPPS